MDLLTPSSPGVFQLCLWPIRAPGYLGGGLPCLSSALWCQYPKHWMRKTHITTLAANYQNIACEPAHFFVKSPENCQEHLRFAATRLFVGHMPFLSPKSSVKTEGILHSTSRAKLSQHLSTVFYTQLSILPRKSKKSKFQQTVALSLLRYTAIIVCLKKMLWKNLHQEQDNRIS